MENPSSPQANAIDLDEYVDDILAESPNGPDVHGSLDISMDPHLLIPLSPPTASGFQPMFEDPSRQAAGMDFNDPSTDTDGEPESHSEGDACSDTGSINPSDIYRVQGVIYRMTPKACLLTVVVGCTPAGLPCDLTVPIPRTVPKRGGAGAKAMEVFVTAHVDKTFTQRWLRGRQRRAAALGKAVWVSCVQNSSTSDKKVSASAERHAWRAALLEMRDQLPGSEAPAPAPALAPAPASPSSPSGRGVSTVPAAVEIYSPYLEDRYFRDALGTSGLRLGDILCTIAAAIAIAAPGQRAATEGAAATNIVMNCEIMCGCKWQQLASYIPCALLDLPGRFPGLFAKPRDGSARLGLSDAAIAGVGRKSADSSAGESSRSVSHLHCIADPLVALDFMNCLSALKRCFPLALSYPRPGITPPAHSPVGVTRVSLFAHILCRADFAESTTRYIQEPPDRGAPGTIFHSHLKDSDRWEYDTLFIDADSPQSFISIGDAASNSSFFRSLTNVVAAAEGPHCSPAPRFPSSLFILNASANTPDFMCHLLSLSHVDVVTCTLGDYVTPEELQPCPENSRLSFKLRLCWSDLSINTVAGILGINLDPSSFTLGSCIAECCLQGFIRDCAAARRTTYTYFKDCLEQIIADATCAVGCVGCSRNVLRLEVLTTVICDEGDASPSLADLFTLTTSALRNASKKKNWTDAGCNDLIDFESLSKSVQPCRVVYFALGSLPFPPDVCTAITAQLIRSFSQLQLPCRSLFGVEFGRILSSRSSCDAAFPSASSVADALDECLGLTPVSTSCPPLRTFISSRSPSCIPSSTFRKSTLVALHPSNDNSIHVAAASLLHLCQESQDLYRHLKPREALLACRSHDRLHRLQLNSEGFCLYHVVLN